MSSKERIKRIKMRIEQNRKYMVTLYNVSLFIDVAIICVPLFLIFEYILLKLESKYNISLWLTNVCACVILICIAVLCVLKGYKKKRYLINNGIQIETNIDTGEVFIWPPGGRYSSMGVYHFVSYYVDENRTYRFRCKVKDDQIDLYHIFTELEEKGNFPKLVVVVNPQNYNQYEALGYNFLLDTLEMNEELVEKILDKMYAKEWNFTC